MRISCYITTGNFSGGLQSILQRSAASAPQEDLWLSMQRYRRAVAITQSSLLVLRNRGSALEDIQRVLADRTRSLFIATLQVSQLVD